MHLRTDVIWLARGGAHYWKTVSAMGDFKKNPLFRRWWFWLIVALILLGLFALRGDLSGTGQAAKEQFQESVD
jgi:hypothetical protein